MTLVHSEADGLSVPAGEGGESETKRPPLAPEMLSHFTVVFEGNLRKLPFGPFSVESPFGRAVSSGYGNAFTQNDALEDALYLALPFVEDALDDPCYDRQRVKDALRKIRTALGTEA